jgi:hypothetical protein
MTTLEDAWNWYRAVANGTNRLAHLAKFWDDLPWEEGSEWAAGVKRDNVLREVSATELLDDSDRVERELDDLAVLVFFSVFEALVRDLVAQQVKPEVEGLQRPTLRTAGKEVLDAIGQGSFFRVLGPFKSVDADLVEQVNQIRRFRNWVAHGRRPDMKPDALVRPKVAYERLSRFLSLIRPPPKTPDPPPPGVP